MQVPRAIQVARLAEHLGRPLEIVCAQPASSGIEPERTAVTLTRISDPAWMRFVHRFTTPKMRLVLFAPDPQRAWSMAAARHIAEAAPPRRDDLIVTFGQPMSCHLAGLALKRRFGNRWISHWSDPWVDNPMAPPIPFSRARSIGFERAVVANADRIIMTSDETADLVMEKYPRAWRDKVSILPHAFDQALYPGRARAHGPLVFRYLGTLYGRRGPQPLLRGLEVLISHRPELVTRLRIELIGEISPRLRDTALRHALPPGLLHLVPQVSYAASLQLMRSADLLLHIDAPADRNVFLASKLIDYLGARRPILAITPAGTARRLMREIGGWAADPTSPDAIASALEDAVGFLASFRDADWGVDDVRRHYEIGTVAAEFCRVAEIDERSGAPSFCSTG